MMKMIKAVEVLVAMLFGLTLGTALDYIREMERTDAIADVYVSMSMEELSALRI